MIQLVYFILSCIIVSFSNASWVFLGFFGVLHPERSNSDHFPDMNADGKGIYIMVGLGGGGGPQFPQG